MRIPDYISPIIGYRVRQWDAAGLKSLNGELWLPGQRLSAVCRAEIRGSIAGLRNPTHGLKDSPHLNCTCGVYAAKSIEHLHHSGYGKFGVHGEVYLWGTVVEHERGWRAQFAYPKSLFLAPDLLPFTLAETDTRLRTLTAFGADIFILRDHELVRLWTNGSGYDAAGLDYLIRERQEYYVRRQSERTLQKGDRVAVLGRGIAVVELADSNEVGLVLGNKQVLRVARKDIALNEQNMRWECQADACSEQRQAKAVREE